MKFSYTLLILISSTFFCIANTDSEKVSIEQELLERGNLALRQVGHRLLEIAGDSTSAIDPIVANDNELILKLNQLNYDSLPSILQTALLQFGINRPYRVMVKECGEDETILGFNYYSVVQNEVACRGRELVGDCHQIVLKFDQAVVTENSNFSSFWPWIIGFNLAFILFFLRINKRKNQPINEGDSKTIVIGNFAFDHHNQKLRYGQQEQDLTYRENKLFYLLVRNKNEVVKRETILAEVWGDEGVIVGRSLDVFISRLRKLLREGDGIEIKNIHGVGYRLELKAA